MAKRRSSRHQLPLGNAMATTLTEDQFMGGLDAIRPGTSERLRKFLEAQEDLGVEYEVLKTLVTRMRVGEIKFTPAVIYPNGVVDTGFTSNQKEALRPFATQLAAAIPGAIVKETPASWFVLRRKADGAPLTIWDFLDHQDGVRAALETLHGSMIAVAGAGS